MRASTQGIEERGGRSDAERRIRALRRRLITLQDDVGPVLPAIADELRALLSADRACIYRPVVTGLGASTEYVYWSGYDDNRMPGMSVTQFFERSPLDRLANYSLTMPDARSGPWRSPIPNHRDHPFRTMPITDSDASRSPIPGMPITQ